MGNEKIRSNNSLILVGYSGHSFVCAEVALLLGYDLIGYYDFEEKKNNPFNLSFLRLDEYLDKDSLIFPAIGNNNVRRKIFENNTNRMVNLTHPSAILTNRMEIGLGNLICAGAIINTFVNIGNGCIINSGSIVEHECNIANFSHIAPGVVLAGNVSIGENTFVGANSVVKQGVKIGNNVTIGAGSVVLKDIKDNSVYVGNPAKELINKKL